MQSSGRSQQDAELFARIAAREQRRLFRFIFGLVPNVADAEEVLQNTNLVLWSKFDQFDPETSFIRWACRIAHIEVRRFRERQQRDARIFSPDFVEEMGIEALMHVETLDRRHDALLECLGKLREFDRKLILLRYADGATTQSVAQTLARPVKSVYASISRIRDLLLDCIRRRVAAENC